MKENNGSVLIIVLVILLVMSIMALSLQNIGWLETKSLHNQKIALEESQIVKKKLRDYEAQLLFVLNHTTGIEQISLPWCENLGRLMVEGIAITGFKIEVKRARTTPGRVAFYHYFPKSHRLILVSEQEL